MGELIAEIIAFVLAIAFIWWKVVPPVRKAMRNQQQTIRQHIEESEQAKTRLAEAERRHADAVAEARVEAAKIRDNARADAQRISEEMHTRAEAEVARIKQRGEDQLGLLRQQVVRQLRAELGADAAASAEQAVREHLESPEAQAETVDRFLDELEDMAGTPRRAPVSSRGEA